jgi:hypothetical protein
MRYLRQFAIPVFIVFTLGVVACASEGHTQSPPSVTPTIAGETPTVPTPGPSLTPTPPVGGGVTGIAAVDAAIKAIAAKDAVALASQAVFRTDACSTAQGAGGPPQCRTGEANGTRVEVLAAASCEGYYLRKDELTATVNRFLEANPQLYAVYKHNGRIFLPGEYVIIFSYSDDRLPGTQGRQVFVSGQGVVGLNFGCGQSPADLVGFQELKDVILKAQAGGQGKCPVASEVCSFAQTVERAVKASDFSAIIANAGTSEYTCPAIPPQGLGGPYPLCDKALGGEKRQGIRIAYLESEGVIVKTQGMREALERWARAETPSATDEFGTGASRLYSIGCPGDASTCGEKFALVFSQVRPPVSYRIQMVLYFERRAGSPRLTFAAFGPLLHADRLNAALTGGRVEFVTPEGWQPVLTFHAAPESAAAVPAPSPEGRATVSQLMALGDQAFPYVSEVGYYGVCGPAGDTSTCPYTERVKTRLAQTQTTLCRCQNPSTTRAMSAEVTDFGGVLYVALNDGSQSFTLTVLNLDGRLFIDDQVCMGRGPETSIHQTVAPCR